MKLIVSDLDGTLLLKGEKSLHRITVSGICEILERGGLFCVASGRSYSELKTLLKDFCDRIYFIANDGALLVYKEKTLYASFIEWEQLKMADTEKNVVAHGKYISYIKSGSERFIRKIKEQYNGHAVITDSLVSIREPIYKIAVYGKKEAMIDSDRVYYDNSMCEYVKRGVNKGTAMRELSKTVKTDICDIVAIGDGRNDIEMFDMAGTSFVMAGAPPAVKKAGTAVAADFKGVLDSLKKEERI